jgi:MoxR-like ATPase
MEGRAMVLPEDVQAVGSAVMGHRLAGDTEMAETLLRETPVP